MRELPCADGRRNANEAAAADLKVERPTWKGPCIWYLVFSVSACNTLVTPVTLRCLKGQTGVSGQNVTKIRNFIIKPLIWLQGCQNEIENTVRIAFELSVSRVGLALQRSIKSIFASKKIAGALIMAEVCLNKS